MKAAVSAGVWPPGSTLSARNFACTSGIFRTSMKSLAIWSRSACRHLGRAGHGEPADGNEIGHPRLGCRRHIGHLRRALLVEHRQDFDLAVAPQRQSRRHIAEEQVDVAAQDVLEHQRLAAIGHVHHAGAGQGHEHVGGEVRRRAVALAAVDDLAGIS
jgi:hypothetical protein